MQYLFLLYDDENKFHSMSEQEVGEVIGAYMAYSAELEKAGAFVGGDALEHSKHASRLRRNGDKTSVEDGPFTDAKEQLGGFYQVEAKDLDEALNWAEKCPAASTGRVEVRPLWNIDG